MMNWIWLGIVIASILVAGFTGNMHQVTIRSFDSAREAVDLAIKLIGIMALWLGIMKVVSDAGLLRIIARWLRRPMRWLFPDVPEDHPAMSAMIMNFGANMLGLANAATPFGIVAMIELNKLNKRKGVASDAMCLFLAINTSSLALLPTGVMGVRAAAGSVDPASIWLPTLFATTCSTLVGILAAKLFMRLRRFRIENYPEVEEAEIEPPTEVDPAGAAKQAALETERAGWKTMTFVWLSLATFVTAAIWNYWQWWGSPEAAGCGSRPVFIIKDFFSNWAVPALMGGLLLFGLSRKVRVYESLVDGAKEGFRVAVRIIPYLVAIIVAVAMFKASGAMSLLQASIGKVTSALGMPTEALPMAVIRPLSGSGAFAYMGSIFTEYGPDSFIGQLVSVMQGSTETTLYVLAVYFGAVGVSRVRHALLAGLTADLAGIIAAVGFSNLFF
jgi:spore maturation protein SpmA/spore maturation protein SpmB